MLKRINKATIVSGVLAALAFCTPAFFYIKFARYSQSWLLYIGSFLFLVVIAVHTIIDCSKRGADETIENMVVASILTTMTGIVISCFLSFLMLVFMVPGWLPGGSPEKVLTGEPVNTIHDKTEGLSIDVFVAATLINFAVGCFAGLLFVFTTKRNQTLDGPDKNVKFKT